MSTNPPPPNTGNIPAITMSALLNVNYGTVSILVLWVYEYAITFDDEKTNFLRNSRSSIVKIIYMVCRYLMFPFVITNTLHNLQLGLALEECESYFRCSLFAGTTVIICAELMFLVRTYALWHRSKAALVIITINFIAFVVPMIVILALFDLNATMIPVSGITSCDDVSRSRIIVWAYVLLLIGETEILLSTMYQAVRYCREVGGRNRLLAILVQHNSFYFCCSLASSVIMISTMYFIPVPYIGLLADFQAVLHGILVTRMHRSLWNSDRKMKHLSNPNDVSLPTMYFRSSPQAE